MPYCYGLLSELYWGCGYGSEWRHRTVIIPGLLKYRNELETGEMQTQLRNKKCLIWKHGINIELKFILWWIRMQIASSLYIVFIHSYV